MRQDLEQRSFKLKSWLSHSHSTTQLHIFLLYTHRTHRRRVSVVVVVVVYTIQQWHGQSVLINYKKEKNNIYVHLCFFSMEFSAFSRPPKNPCSAGVFIPHNFSISLRGLYIGLIY